MTGPNGRRRFFDWFAAAVRLRSALAGGASIIVMLWVSPLQADAAIGESLARQWCSSCHEVGHRPVANDGAANLAADGKSDAYIRHPVRRGIIPVVGTYLQNQTRGNPFPSRPGDMQELAAIFQPFQHHACSGRQAFPPLCAAIGQHTAASDRGAAGAKAVASLANQDAGLKGTFHNETPESIKARMGTGV